MEPMGPEDMRMGGRAAAGFDVIRGGRRMVGEAKKI